MSKQCSDLFEDVFDTCTGGCLRYCACGRTHFDPVNNYDWESGELERLEERSQKDPDQCVAHEGSIGTMSIAGLEIVHGCSCDIAARHEKFILGHASKIAEFLNRYAAELRERAGAMQVSNKG